MNGQGDFDVSGYIPNPGFMGRAEDDGSNPVGDMSRVDDQDGERTRTIHRHTAYQTQELKKYYKEHPHPTVTERLELGRRLHLEPKQIKFWFQNKRTQSKIHKERLANGVLREEHDILREAQERLRQTMILSPCIICGRSSNCGAVDDEVRRLRFENAVLQRHCDTLLTLSSINLADIYPGWSKQGATELVKLAQRMTLNYYTSIRGSLVDTWETIQEKSERQNIRLMIRKNTNEPGEHTGIVVSASTSVWLPVNQQALFAFLSNQSFRHEWDILTNNTCMEETIKIQNVQSHGNTLSLLRILENGMLVLQEIWNDVSGALVVYSPVVTNLMEEVRLGANSDSVQLLPSGFMILPDKDSVPDHRGNTKAGGGCRLALGFHILVSSNPTAELPLGSVKLVEDLVDHTIGKIKSALHILT